MKKIIFVEGIDNCGKTTLLSQQKLREELEKKGNVYYGVMPDGLWRPILKGLNKLLGPTHPIQKYLFKIYHQLKLYEIELILCEFKYDYLIFDRSYLSFLVYNCISEDKIDIVELSNLIVDYLKKISQLANKYGFEIEWVYLYPHTPIKKLSNEEHIRHIAYIDILNIIKKCFREYNISVKIIKSKKIESRINDFLSIT